ncbi:MAG: hypothetical protein F4Y63_08600 [Chloroflexi bacterium]|nr:hypothetical protein [Chloroflexota bacterium]
MGGNYRGDRRSESSGLYPEYIRGFDGVSYWVVDGSPWPGGRNWVMAYIAVAVVIVFYSFVRLIYGDIPLIPLFPVIVGSFAWVYDAFGRIKRFEARWRNYPDEPRVRNVWIVFALDIAFAISWILWLNDPLGALGHIFIIVWVPVLFASIRLRKKR